MAQIKNQKEIEIMRQGGEILVSILEEIVKNIKPGISTLNLNELAERLIFKAKAKPSFKGHEGYPYALCTSINNEIVHGLPSSRQLKEGDIIGIDLGVFFGGYHTDSALTVPVREIDSKKTRLIKKTYEALISSLPHIKEGNYISDISFSIQREIEEAGFSPVRTCTGHGIGKSLHENPVVPNFVSWRGKKLVKGIKLEKNMTLAIEPMATFKKETPYIKKDGWTVATSEDNFSAHFEYTVVVGQKGSEVLTPFRLPKFPSLEKIVKSSI